MPCRADREVGTCSGWGNLFRSAWRRPHARYTLDTMVRGSWLDVALSHGLCTGSNKGSMAGEVRIRRPGEPPFMTMKVLALWESRRAMPPRYGAVGGKYPAERCVGSRLSRRVWPIVSGPYHMELRISPCLPGAWIHVRWASSSGSHGAVWPRCLACAPRHGACERQQSGSAGLQFLHAWSRTVSRVRMLAGQCGTNRRRIKALFGVFEDPWWWIFGRNATFAVIIAPRVN